MSRPPKNLPQTDEEMLQSIVDSKKSSVYRKSDTLEANELRIHDIVSSLAEGLENTADERNRVRLSDLKAVKRVSLRYVRMCADNSTLPNMSGLAMALGITRQAIYDHIKRHPESETSKWLENLSDSFGESMMQAALSGTVAPVPAIFVAKARYSWKDSIVLETAQHDPLGETISIEEIEERYQSLPAE